MTRDTGVGLVLLGLAGLYWLGADQIRVSRLEGIVGAQAVPKALAVSLALLSVLLVAQDLWRPRRAAVAAEPDGAGGVDAHLRALGILVIGIAYLLTVSTIGYLPAITLLVLATAHYLGRPWSGGLLVVALALAAFYYVIFVRLLDIPLPPGIWQGVWQGLAG